MTEAAVQAYAAGKRFGAATLARWLACAPADQDALLGLVEQLRLGENHVRDVLDALEAIALRRGCGFVDVLAAEPVNAVLNAGQGRNETLHALKQVLRRLRFPQLAATEMRLRRLAQELGLPAGVTVTLPENLEGDEIVVTVQAGSAAELRRRMAAAGTAMDAAAVDEMYRLLAGEW